MRLFVFHTSASSSTMSSLRIDTLRLFSNNNILILLIVHTISAALIVKLIVAVVAVILGVFLMRRKFCDGGAG